MEPEIGSAAFIPEIIVKKQGDSEPPQGLLAAVSDYGTHQVGMSERQDQLYKLVGYNIAEVPKVVICQARQTDNIDHGWADQFTIQVIETSKTFVRIRVRRVDFEQGWRQNLRIDVLVIN